MPTYAKETDVSSDRSRAEIERTLSRYGATGFAYGWDAGRVMVAFQAHGRRVRFVLALPKPEDFLIIRNAKGYAVRRRTPVQARAACDQAVRQRWRALLLSIKAKLESVEAGIETFEESFMAQIVLPDGSTVADRVMPQIESAYQGGEFAPFLLPAPKDKP